jgi:EAL and modified HD-GYP domain-containing signal transduction protein
VPREHYPAAAHGQEERQEEMQPANTRLPATNPTPGPKAPANNPSPATPGADERVFIARQPIFEAREQRVYGYELLFRSSEENAYSSSDGRLASSQTISRAVHTIGLEAVVGDRRAFINVTRDLLLDEIYTLLPPEQCVVEILEDLILDPEVVAACAKLRAAGYGLALDDVTNVARVEPLAEYADIIKLDLSMIPPAERAAVFRDMAPFRDKLLAEKVETKEDYEQALALGCQYVQGYFFCRPEMMTGKSLVGAEATYRQFQNELAKPQLDLAALERVIKQDVSLTYNLFRYLNSVTPGARHNLASVQDALARLGERSLRKWGSLVTLTSAYSKKPSELMLTSLVRANFCESIAVRQNLPQHRLDMFLIGLLSSVDAALNTPMAQILEQTCVSDAVRTVLLNDPAAPRDLTRMYALALACERGAWGTVVKASAGLRLTQGDIATVYYDALTCANKCMAA